MMKIRLKLEQGHGPDLEPHLEDPPLAKEDDVVCQAEQLDRGEGGELQPVEFWCAK